MTPRSSNSLPGVGSGSWVCPLNVEEIVYLHNVGYRLLDPRDTQSGRRVQASFCAVSVKPTHSFDALTEAFFSMFQWRRIRESTFDSKFLLTVNKSRKKTSSLYYARVLVKPFYIYTDSPMFCTIHLLAWKYQFFPIRRQGLGIFITLIGSSYSALMPLIMIRESSQLLLAVFR